MKFPASKILTLSLLVILQTGAMTITGKITDPHSAPLGDVAVILPGLDTARCFSKTDGTFTLDISATSQKPIFPRLTTNSVTWNGQKLTIQSTMQQPAKIDILDIRGRTLGTLFQGTLPAGNSIFTPPTRLAQQLLFVKISLGSEFLLLRGFSSVSKRGTSQSVLSKPTAITPTRIVQDTLIFTRPGLQKLRIPLSSMEPDDTMKVSMEWDELVALTGNNEMSVQFVNNTHNRYPNDSLYIFAVARNTNNIYCVINPDGTLTECPDGGNAADYSFRVSEYPSMQLPFFLTGGRIYFSFGSPVDLTFTKQWNNIIIPSYTYPEDPEIPPLHFDFIEFAIDTMKLSADMKTDTMAWFNTTQVDMIGIPSAITLFKDSLQTYTETGYVGITEQYADLLSAWNTEVPDEFKSLAGSFRILEPYFGSFKASGINGHYFDSYIDEIWGLYGPSSAGLPITIWEGTYTGKVQEDGRMAFTKPGDPGVYYVGKPTSEEVWAGSGVFLGGNGIETQLRTRLCAGFHRHVLESPADLANPSRYYLNGPCDYYAKFCHQHSIGGLSYGFCYDDIHEQSSLIACAAPRGVILTISW